MFLGSKYVEHNYMVFPLLNAYACCLYTICWLVAGHFGSCKCQIPRCSYLSHDLHPHKLSQTSGDSVHTFLQCCWLIDADLISVLAQTGVRPGFWHVRFRWQSASRSPYGLYDSMKPISLSLYIYIIYIYIYVCICMNVYIKKKK